MKENALKIIGAIIVLINVSLWGYKNYKDIDIGRYVYVPFTEPDAYEVSQGKVENIVAKILDTKTGQIYWRIEGIMPKGRRIAISHYRKIDMIKRQHSVAGEETDRGKYDNQ
jgi:hypothetical protein